jgi:TetR/AcrR family transcriptional regulator
MKQQRSNPPGHHPVIVAEKLGRGPRLPAAERREALIEAATQIFAERGYRRTTTAEIAAEAKVSEPILYRHFPSKVDLFIACIESAWQGMEARWTAAVEEVPDGAQLLEMFLRAQGELRKTKPQLVALLVQGLADAPCDPAIQAYMRKHVRRVHGLMTTIFTAAQKGGGLAADRDPEAEAWTHMGLSFVSMLAGRLGVMTDADVEKAIAQRKRWLTGE